MIIRLPNQHQPEEKTCNSHIAFLRIQFKIFFKHRTMLQKMTVSGAFYEVGEMTNQKILAFFQMSGRNAEIPKAVILPIIRYVRLVRGGM
jgi:hypothetical protein